MELDWEEVLDMGGFGFDRGCFTSPAAILVLFILLVIITSAFFF